MAYAGLFDRPWAYLVIIFPVRDLLVSFGREIGWNAGARKSGKIKSWAQIAAQISIPALILMGYEGHYVIYGFLLLAVIVTAWSCHDYMPWRKFYDEIKRSQKIPVLSLYFGTSIAFFMLILFRAWLPASIVGTVVFLINMLSSFTRPGKERWKLTPFGRKFHTFIPIVFCSTGLVALALHDAIPSTMKFLTIVPVLVGFLILFIRQVGAEVKMFAEEEYLYREWGEILLISTICFGTWLFAREQMFMDMVTLPVIGLIVLSAIATIKNVTRWDQLWRYIMHAEDIPTT